MAADPTSAEQKPELKPVPKPAAAKPAPKPAPTEPKPVVAEPKSLEKETQEYKIEELFRSDVLYFAPRRVVRLTFKEDHGDGKLVDGDKIDVAEYGMGDVKPLTDTIAKVLEAMERNKAISYGDAGEVAGLKMQGLIHTVADTNEEILVLLTAACYANYSRNIPERKRMTRELFEDYSLGRLAIILKTVWSVNWEHGFLKNAVDGLLRPQAESKT